MVVVIRGYEGSWGKLLPETTESLPLEHVAQILAALDKNVRFPRQRAHRCGQECPRSCRPSAKIRDRCAGFSFSNRTRSATLSTAPQAGDARPSLATPASLCSALELTDLWAEPSRTLCRCPCCPGSRRCGSPPGSSARRRCTNCRPDPHGTSLMWVIRTLAGHSASYSNTNPPIPAPLPHVPRHVIQTISVRRKCPHRTRVRVNPVVEERIIAGVAHIVAIVARATAVVVRLAFRDGVAPRKPLPTHPAPCRLLPLRFRR